MTKSITETVSTAQADLEKLVSDLRGLLSAKELDAVPEIHMLRQRIDDGMSNVRDSAVRAAQEAARLIGEERAVGISVGRDDRVELALACPAQGQVLIFRTLAVGALLGFMLGRR